jgi:hypothetical protein
MLAKLEGDAAFVCLPGATVLLKNPRQRGTRLRGLCLYTDALIRAMGLRDPASAGMREHRETFESVGAAGNHR